MVAVPEGHVDLYERMRDLIRLRLPYVGVGNEVNSDDILMLTLAVLYSTEHPRFLALRSVDEA